jgi:hypothetical protein
MKIKSNCRVIRCLLKLPLTNRKVSAEPPEKAPEVLGLTGGLCGILLS